MSPHWVCISDAVSAIADRGGDLYVREKRLEAVYMDVFFFHDCHAIYNGNLSQNDSI